MKSFFKFFLIILFFCLKASFISAAEQTEKLLNPGWGFKGFFGKFDRGSLQRGYQVYTEVCAA